MKLCWFYLLLLIFKYIFFSFFLYIFSHLPLPSDILSHSSAFLVLIPLVFIFSTSSFLFSFVSLLLLLLLFSPHASFLSPSFSSVASSEFPFSPHLPCHLFLFLFYLFSSPLFLSLKVFLPRRYTGQHNYGIRARKGYRSIIPSDPSVYRGIRASDYHESALKLRHTEAKRLNISSESLFVCLTVILKQFHENSSSEEQTRNATQPRVTPLRTWRFKSCNIYANCFTPGCVVITDNTTNFLSVC